MLAALRLLHNPSLMAGLSVGYGPLTSYVKLRFAHAPGMPGTFSHHRLQRKPLVSDPGMHHGTCVTHVPWQHVGIAKPRWREKRSRYSRRMRNLQFYSSGKGPIGLQLAVLPAVWLAYPNIEWGTPHLWCIMGGFNYGNIHHFSKAIDSYLSQS